MNDIVGKLVKKQIAEVCAEALQEDCIARDGSGVQYRIIHSENNPNEVTVRRDSDSQNGPRYFVVTVRERF